MANYTQTISGFKAELNPNIVRVQWEPKPKHCPIPMGTQTLSKSNGEPFQNTPLAICETKPKPFPCPMENQTQTRNESHEELHPNSLRVQWWTEPKLVPSSMKN